jgi:hypothetical protein
MDFDPTASAFSRIARIGTVGFGRPPVGEDKHSVILQVSTKQWEKSKDPVRGVKSGNQIAEMDSQLSYIVNGYIDTGRVIIINGKSCKIYAPMGSFVYVVHHDGEVNDWRHGIEGAEEVAMNTYKLEIEPESYKDIVTRIEPIEPNGLSLSLHVGPNIPLSNFANDYSTGFNVMADIGYEISRRLSVVAFFAYNFFPAMSSGMDDISIINVALNSAYRVLKNPSKALSLRVGPDLYIQDFKDIDFGYNAGFSCLHLLCRKLELEAGVDYHSHFNQDNWFLQSHVGIIFKF